MDVSARIEALEAEVAQLKAAVEVAEQPRAELEIGERPVSRRNPFRLGAVAAAAGAVGTVLMADKAAAADGDAVTLGSTVSGTGLTRADNTSTTAAAGFLFQDGSSFNNLGAAFDCALAGWTSAVNRPHGIYGYTNQPTNRPARALWPFPIRLPHQLFVLGTTQVGRHFAFAPAAVPRAVCIWRARSSSGARYWCQDVAPSVVARLRSSAARSANERGSGSETQRNCVRCEYPLISRRCDQELFQRPSASYLPAAQFG